MSSGGRASRSHASLWWGLGLSLLFVSDVSAASPLVVVATEKSLCGRLAQSLDVSMLKQRRLHFAGEGVRSIEWQPVTLGGTAPVATVCSEFHQARVDLNRDGRPDQVIRSRFCMKGTPSDSLYVFPAESDVLLRASWQNLAPLHDTLDKFELTGGTYPLEKLRPNWDRVELRETFVLGVVSVEGAAYVAMTAPPFEWIVVGSFQGGGTLQDDCYLQSS